MSDETLPPTETEPGVEQIDGEQYEYPFRVTDFHGEEIATGLDTIPPLLDQEQIDNLSSLLDNWLAGSDLGTYQNQILASVLEALPDSEYGRGGTPEWLTKQDGGDE